MSRQERAQQLNELVKTEQGLSEIKYVYLAKCDPPGGQAASPTPALMIDAILNKEYPPQSPGYLAPS